MTPERVDRLLRMGAHLYFRSDGQWDLFRSGDRRRRRVGVLSSETVETLRARGELRRLSSEGPECWVWSRCSHDDWRPATSPHRLPKSATQSSARGAKLCLLARVLTSTQDSERRHRLATAALNWRQDFEAVQSAGIGAGMNWSALMAGSRIDGGAAMDQRLMRHTGSLVRMRVVEAHLSRQEQILLRLMIIEDRTRPAAARAIGVSDQTVERLAKRTLNRLADVVENEVKQPGQATPSA